MADQHNGKKDNNGNKGKRGEKPRAISIFLGWTPPPGFFQLQQTEKDPALHSNHRPLLEEDDLAQLIAAILALDGLKRVH